MKADLRGIDNNVELKRPQDTRVVHPTREIPFIFGSLCPLNRISRERERGSA